MQNRNSKTQNLIIDGHLDLAWNAVELKRDLTQPLAVIRARETSPPTHGQGTATVGLPALRAAGVRVVFATLFTYPYGTVSEAYPGYRTPQEAYDRAMAQVDYYHWLEGQEEARIIRDRADLEAAVAGDGLQPGLVLLMEGADPLRTPADLATFRDAGLRMAGLSWHATRYAAGSDAPGPLTGLGRELLAEMARLEITLDISHLAEKAFWQALKVYAGPVIASHANCRAIVPGERQLSDAMIQAVAARDGVIGLMCYNPFIHPDRGRRVQLADLLPHVAHIAGLVGTAHIGLGSDMDGGIGRESVPAELDTIADLPRLASTLAGAGYDEKTIAGIMGMNWLRVLRRILS